MNFVYKKRTGPSFGSLRLEKRPAGNYSRVETLACELFMMCAINDFSQVEKELRDICSDILDVLDKHLIFCASTGESKVFYYKM